MWFFLFLLLIVLCVRWNIKWKKKELIDFYPVEKELFRKWIRHCCPKIDYDKWLKRKKLHIGEVLFIMFCIGFPGEFACLSKGDLKEKCDTDYESLSQCANINPEKLGLYNDGYLAMDVFPPLVSRNLMERMNG